MGLVERDDALAALDSLLAAAVAGKGRVAMVSGAVATGKTELLTMFGERVVDLNGLAITAVGSRAERGLQLGVFGQLLMDAPLVVEERRRAMDLLHEGASGIPAGAESTSMLDPQIVHSLCTILLELSRRYPLVIVVDDVDQADLASLVCLSYLARHVRFAPMLAVFSQSGPGRSADSGTFGLESLSRPPNGTHISLGPLSADGVRLLAATGLAAEDAERVAPRWHELTGGNPLLVNGLIEDYRQTVADGGTPDGEPADAGHYAEAIVSCLRRVDPRLTRIAFGIAIYPEAAGLDQLIGVEPTHINRAVRALKAAGVLHQGQFRHPAARAAALAEIDADERQELHRRAAVLAHHGGAASRVVADQLMGAGRTNEPWVVAVLEDAARQALRDGQVDAGVRYLKLAWQACGDERHRAKIMTTMLRASWRINPSTSTNYLPELTVALQNGHLRGSDAVALTKALLWNGEFDEAKAVFEHLNDATDLDPESLTELACARPLLRSTWPGFLSVLRRPAAQPPVMSTVNSSHRFETASALVAVLTHGPSEQLFTSAERILQNSRLDEMSLDTVQNALLVFMYGGWCDKAAAWCDQFMEEAATRRAPSRMARLCAIRAEVSLRLGDLSAAVRHAKFCFDAMPASSWGVAAGAPISTMIVAATAMGDFDLVRDMLNQPVPDEMFHTRWGLHYQQARGRYSLAIGQYRLALCDFEHVGEIAARWQLDVPGLVPWRTDAAEALLRMGRPDKARKLVEEQLNRCGKNNTRVQGIATRLLAATSQLRHRPTLLRQAVDLQNGGDKYEMARALVDLTEAYQVLGEPRRAGVIARRARALAERVEAQPLLKSLNPELGREEREGSAPSPSLAVGTAVLSEAEQRVVVLAADGYTNREISKKLYITISTVEQHLTRIYRKLNVTRRTDLLAHSSIDYTFSS